MSSNVMKGSTKKSSTQKGSVGMVPAAQVNGQKPTGNLRKFGSASGRGSSAGNNQSSIKKTTRLQKLPVGNQGSTKESFTNKKVLPKIKSHVERFDDLLAGSLDDLPPKPPSEVRIFLSSTFSDYRMERNWLMKDAYGKLQHFCHGLDLDIRVVDMRWGVTDDATNDHITEKLCLAEIENCKRVSLGPYFVAMLGNRYGYQPLQYAFIAKEFDLLYAEAESLCHPKVALLKEWYKRDDNNVPPVYCIQSIRSQLPNFGDHSPGFEIERAKDTALWNEVRRTLHDILRTAVSSLASKGIITQARKHDFFKSVTECEVTGGILEVENPQSHALCYMRDFEGLDASRLTDANSHRNIDTSKVDGKVLLNEEVINFQNKLKHETIPCSLQAGNVRQYTVGWQDGGLDPKTHEEHAQYLSRFSEDFVEDTKRLVKSALHRKHNLIPASEYYSDYEEALHHSHFCASKCETFQGQQDVLKQIQAYLGDPKKTKPLTVSAESGVGKTSIMAMVMKLLPQWFKEGTMQVIRFLGTSPYSGSLDMTLRSVMGQLADNVDMIIEPVGYSTPKRAVANFSRFLRTIARKTDDQIFILLDSVDQLSSADGAYDMQWLPKELPSRVHIILSMLPNYGNLLENTQTRIGDKDCFIQVKPLPQETGEKIIDSYLKRQGRKITASQRSLILNCLLEEPSPLFLKLFLDKALSWRSYTNIDNIRMEKSVRDAITHLFDDLEVKFGQSFISRALGYITVGLDGLTELELEDVLSCDDTVLDELYIYHDPPIEEIVRLPPLLWARVRIHINEYLTERSSSGKTTFFWYHRQFIENAQERYAKGDEGRILHRRLAELYLAENGVKKDITLSKRKNLVIPKADRQVTPQPMVAKNQRMLQALPYHLQRAMNISYLKQVALCNLRFLMTRMEGFSLEVLLKDLRNAIDVAKLHDAQGDYELHTLLDALDSAKTSLRSASQIPVELLGRVMDDRKAMPHVSGLLNQAKEHVLKSPHPALLPLYPCFGDLSELQWSLSNATICDINTEKTVLVVRVSNTSIQDARFIVLDCVGQRIAVDIPVDKNLTISPSLPGEGMKLAVVKYLNEVDADVKTKNKSGKSSYACGDIILDIITFSENAGKVKTLKVCTKNDMDMRGSRAEYSVMTSDFGLLTLGYRTNNEISVAVIDVKKANVLKTVVIAGATSITNMTWLEKTHCIVTTHMASGTGSVVIVNASPKKKETVVELSSAMIEDAVAFVPEIGFLVGLVGSGEHCRVVIIQVRTGVMRNTPPLPEGHPEQISVNSTQKSLVILSNKRCLFRISDISQPVIEPIEGSLDHDVTCMSTDPDGDLVLTGDTEGNLHMSKCEDNRLTPVGRIVVHQHPITKIIINREDAILVTADSSAELKLWNFNLLLVKCQQARSSPKKSTDTTQQLLSNYQDVADILFTPDSEHLVTLSKDGSMIVWDINTQQFVRRIVQLSNVEPKMTKLACKGSVLLILNGLTKKLLGIEFDSGEEIDPLKYLHGEVLAFNLSADTNKAVVLASLEGKSCVTFIDMLARKIVQNIPLKEHFDSADIEISLTENEQFVLFKVLCSPKQLEIIRKSEKRNNLVSSMDCKHVFYAVNVQKKTGELLVCNRMLSTVPCLGHCYVKTRKARKDGWVLIGRERVTVLWDLETATCDQRMVKGTKIPMFFRPAWVEEDGDNYGLCKGATGCMDRCTNGEVIVLGSEDGWVMVYDSDSGRRIAGRVPNKKRPNHQAAVVKVVISGDARWVASYDASRTLKVWSAHSQIEEIASIKLGLEIKQMIFSPDSMTLTLHGGKGINQGKVLIFRLTGGALLDPH